MCFRTVTALPKDFQFPVQKILLSLWKRKQCFPMRVKQTTFLIHNVVSIDKCSYKYVLCMLLQLQGKKRGTFTEEMGLSPSFYVWVQTLQVIVHAFQVDCCSVPFPVPIFKSIIWKTWAWRNKCLRIRNKFTLLLNARE